MISVLIEGHNFKHDLYELIRVFLPNDEINFTSKMEDKEWGNFLYSSVGNQNGQVCIITELYEDGNLVNKSCEFIDKASVLDYSLEKNIKLKVKKAVYESLVKLTGVKLFWGILTGIRPLKIVHKLCDRGFTQEEIFNILKDEYRLDIGKINLMLDIAKIQRRHIYPLDRDKYSLYIGIPFCPSRCYYCSFPSFKLARGDKIVNDYIDSLIYELSNVSEVMKNKKLNTVYIGGGTPTSLEAKDLGRIIEFVRKNFNEDIKEFTVEAGRPDTINLEKLEMLKSYRINRLSINPQSMNNQTLKLIGRNHDVKSFIDSYNLAKSLNFDIINMDIILGLPDESIKEVRNTLEIIEGLNPENLTIHTLALKRGSKLHRYKVFNDSNPSNEIEVMLDEANKYAKKMDMVPYYLYRQKQILGNLENIGYSKEGKESIYNISMMEEKETVIGVGLGAVSKIYFPEEDVIERVPNFKDLKSYIGRIGQLVEKREFILKNKLYMKG